MKPKESNLTPSSKTSKQLDGMDYLKIIMGIAVLPFVLPNEAMKYYYWVINNYKNVSIVLISAVAIYIIYKNKLNN